MEKVKPNDNNQRTHTHTVNQTWGTWDELLLACAVKRHGFKDWDSVAMEVQSRSALPQLLTTARNCELKFNDLKRRFTELAHSHLNDNNHHQNDDGTLSPDNASTVDYIPWLEELRKLRVDELRRQVQRSDVSIVSLQMKVKKLEEEIERSVKEKQESGEDNKPDLEVSASCSSDNHGKQGEELHTIEPDGSEPVGNEVGKPVHGDESDRDNQSVNESNSTCSRSENGETGKVKLEPDFVRDGIREPVDNGDKAVGGESENEKRDGDSVQPSDVKKDEDSSELRNSGVDGEAVVTKESSEVQSSATLTGKRNKRRRKELSGATSGEGQTENAEVSVKSQPLAGILEMIKGHDHSSLFERLLENQESEKYKRLVRQHMDLDKIQRKLRKGYYSSCSLALFRDLLLLFNNAIVLFPKDSIESATAHQLSRIVSSEIKAHIQNPPPKSPQQKIQSFEISESLASKPKSSAPILVCRKRTSIAAKSSFGNAGQQSDDCKKPCPESKPSIKPCSSETAEETPTVETKTKEKPTTGIRSFRRSNKNLVHNINSRKPMVNSAGSKTDSANKSAETITKAADKKKVESTSMTEKKKSAVDFLRRIKRNSPADTLKVTNGGGTSAGGNGGGGGNSKTAGNGGKVRKKKNGNIKNDRGKERILRNSGGDRKDGNDNFNSTKRNVGRPSKRGVEAEAVSDKRAREGNSKEEEFQKKPKKRARR